MPKDIPNCFSSLVKQPPHLEETNQIEVLDKEEAQPFVEGQLVKIRKTSEEETKRRWHNEWDLFGGVKGMKSYPSVTTRILWDGSSPKSILS